jgi:hypothetical protein
MERYQSGAKTSFKLTLPEDTDLRPGVDFRLFAGSTTRRAGVLELWDAANGRIVEFSKRTGEYVQQFVLSGAQASFSDVRGLFVIDQPDAPPSLYWTTGTSVYSTLLEDPNAQPSPSPEPTASPSPTE